MLFRCFLISVKLKGDLHLLHLNENQQGKKIATWRKEKVTVRDKEGKVDLFQFLLTLLLIM